MGGSGYDAALARLRQVAQLTGRTPAAETAIQQLEALIATYRAAIPAHRKKTVLMMGGSRLNWLYRRWIVETTAETLRGLLQQLVHYPWDEPTGKSLEPGLKNVPLRHILQIDPDVIFVQTYPPSPVPVSQQLAHHPDWQRLKAVQTQQVYEVEQFWHAGNGTRLIRIMLQQLLPLIYPELFLRLWLNLGLIPVL